MADYAGNLAVVNISGDPVAFADEATTANAGRTAYQITNPTKRAWSLTAPVTVERDGVAVPAGEYTVRHIDGTILFDVAQAVSAVITVTGQYLPLVPAASAYQYTYRKEALIHDVTRFGDEWRRRLPGVKFGSGTLSLWDVTDPYYADALVAGDVVVLEFAADVGAPIERCYALVQQEEMSAAIEDPQSAVVTFISTEELKTLA